jgi:tyrosinase
VTKLSAENKTEFVQAILKLKKVRSPFDMRLSYYDQLVSWHLLAQCCPKPEHPDTPWPSHFNPAIWPWHRILLYLFEDGLRVATGKHLAIPYWDWTDPKSADVVFTNDLMGPKQGDPKRNYVVTTGPFRKDAWQLNLLSAPSEDPGQSRWLVRAFGVNDQEPGLHLPTAQEVADALALKVYDVAPFDITSDPDRSFRARLDGAYGFIGKQCSTDGVEELTPGRSPRTGLHSAVHRYVAGLFKVGDEMWYGTLKTHASPNDPVFWLHHAFLDKIWADWMARHGRTYLPEKEIARTGKMLVSVPGLKTPLRPFERVAPNACTPGGVLDHHKLGYAYDTDRIDK